MSERAGNPVITAMRLFPPLKDRSAGSWNPAGAGDLRSAARGPRLCQKLWWIDGISRSRMTATEPWCPGSTKSPCFSVSGQLLHRNLEELCLTMTLDITSSAFNLCGSEMI